MNKKINQQSISIDLSDKEAEGTYSNLTLVASSQAEFVIDFARLVPGAPKAKVFSRIIMTPMALKALQINLTGNLNRYERMYGEIKLVAQPQVVLGNESETEN